MINGSVFSTSTDDGQSSVKIDLAQFEEVFLAQERVSPVRVPACVVLFVNPKCPYFLELRKLGGIMRQGTYFESGWSLKYQSFTELEYTCLISGDECKEIVGWILGYQNSSTNKGGV